MASLLHDLAGHPVGWTETPTGPELCQSINSLSCHFSLSYALGVSWIALGKGVRIGVDAVALSPVPERDSVATLYLGPRAVAQIRGSAAPDHTFARLWAAHEARCKLAKTPLRENFEPPHAPVIEWEDSVMTVAVALGTDRTSRAGH